MSTKMRKNHGLKLSNIFAGRRKEIHVLQEHLKEAIRGSGHLVVISGEEGIGKTSLVRHFNEMASASGAVVISIELGHFHSFQPYQPFVELVSRLDGSGGSIPAELMPEQLGTPGDVVPESLFSLQARQTLAQQRLVTKIVEAAQEKPLVISLLNLHLSPVSTWRFVHYLCENIMDKKILVLTTLQQDSVQLNSVAAQPFTDVLQRMNREGLIERLHLERFDRKQLGEYLYEAFERRDFSARFTKLLLEMSGGLPKQVARCLERMVDAGLIFQENGVWFDDETKSEKSVFEFARDEQDIALIKSVIQDLSADHLALLKYATLMTGPINHNTLALITRRSRIDVIKDLTLLEERSLLTLCGDDRYELKRPAVRAAVLEEVSEEERREMHRIIAVGIKEDPRLDPSERIHCLAYHVSRTDDHTSAFQYLRQAGELSARNYAFLEAQELFEQALSRRSVIAGAGHRSEILQVLIWSAWLDRVLGNWQKSLCSYTAAIEFCKDHDGPLRKQIRLQQGLTYFRLNDWPNAKSCMESCLEDSANLRPLDRAMANYGLGNVYFELGSYDRAREFYEIALASAEDLGAKQLMANIFNNLGAIENIRGYQVGAIALYSKSIPIFKSLTDNFGLARVYHNIGMTHADDGNWQQANQFYAQSLAFSDVMGLAPLKTITFLNRALALAHLKEFKEAREYNFKAYHLLQRLHDELGLAEYHKVEGVIEREHGNFSVAEKQFNQALDKFTYLENKLGCAECEHELGVLALAKDERDEAASWLTRALLSFQKLGLKDRMDVLKSQLDALETTPGSAHQVFAKEVSE